MLPPHTAVTITADDHELVGYTGFIHKVRGDADSTGEPIPDGWVEVIFDPMDTNGFHTELFREEDLMVCGC